METLVANITGKVRRETLDGRSYLVAPVVLMRGDSVMNGSKGALFYPSSEVAKRPGMWNHIPITDGHPTENGSPVSARSAKVLERYKLGIILNDRMSGSDRVAEAWYDEELTRNKSPKTYQKLTENTPFDLSTGLMTENVVAANGSQAKGRSYSHVARNYDADHVASLVDQVGACSLRDGCGVLVGNACESCGGKETTTNEYTFDAEDCPKCGASMEGDPDSGKCNSCGHKWGTLIKPVTNEEKKSLWRQLGGMLGITTPTENAFCATGKGGGQVKSVKKRTNNEEGDEDMATTKKDELVTHLTTNCDCWKGQEKVLTNLDEATLTRLKEREDAATQNALTINALREIPELKDVALNELPAAFAKKAAPAASDEKCPECGGVMSKDHVCKKEVMNRLKPASERLTPEEIDTLEIAREVTQNSKSQLLDLVVNANASNDAAKKAIRPLYEKLSYKELKTLADNLPKGRPTTNDDHGDLLLNFFTGASGGGHHTTNRGSEPDPNDVLEPFYTPAKS